MTHRPMLARQIIQKICETNTGGLIRAIKGGIQVSVEVSDWDRIGCIINKVDFEFDLDAGVVFEPELIEQKFTYLGERLQIVEKDDDLYILRSEQPRDNGKDISYYEVVVNFAGMLSLVRYTYCRSRLIRKSVPIPMTFEGLERLLTDLTNIVDGEVHRDASSATGGEQEPMFSWRGMSCPRS
jgi:hypothetical protein